MSNSVAMHSQISSIMEVLTKAAVAEICKLVDDGYAILRLEVSRSQQENEALKRKLSMHMAKPCDAGRCERRSRVRAESAVTRFDGPQLCDDGRDAVFAKEEMFIKQLDIRSGCEPAATDKRESRRQSTANVQKSTEKTEEERLESVCIKEEGSDEDPKHSALQSPLNSSMPRALEGEVVSPEEELRELPEEQRSAHRHSPWIDGGFGTSFKADPENEKESSTLRLEQPGAGTCPGPMTGLGYDYSIYERPGQLDTFFTQASPDPEGEEAVCSFGTGADPESLAGDPELLPGPFTESRAGNSPSSPAFHEEKPEVIVIDPEATEDQLSSVWTEEMTSGASQALHKHVAGDGRSGRAQQSKYMKIRVPQALPLDRAGLSASFETPGMSGYSTCEDAPAMTKSGPLYHRADARDRRFICTYCGKSFSCLKNLETHQRVHTGERPFSCAQCGKRFSQSAHLKKHQSVHTGEKPFGCGKCGKRFADSSNLKRHQNVHTGERPFRCAQCGKRFSLIGNLKRHQSVHMGKKPYRGAVWEGLVL